MFPTAYQNYIFASRYARWSDELQRRETWDEAVDRYLEYMWNKTQQVTGYRIPTGTIQRLRRAIVNLDVMPSMRALSTAGPALERDNMSGYNPVAGETLVLTREDGLVPIESIAGMERTVLNKEGRWTNATFSGYGLQPVRTVHLKLNSNTKHAVRATGNHRWVLSDGQVVSTDELHSGDRIDFVVPSKPSRHTIDYRLGVQHGFVYGDGTATYSQQRVKGYMFRICKDAQDILPWFDEYPVSYPPSNGGDPLVMMYGDFAKTHALKELPSAHETEEYLLGFFCGWLAADGSVGKNSHVTICCNKQGVEWLRTVAPKVGIVVQNVYEMNSTTNFGTRSQRQFTVTINRGSLAADDFLITRKRAAFVPVASHHVVSSVEDAGERAQVYCAHVPDTNTFVLSHGLVTGNCSALNVDCIEAFDEAMYILMCGTGVGFSVEATAVSHLPFLPSTLRNSEDVIVVDDSKIGWAQALRQLLHSLYSGYVPKWDVSRVRPAGARLVTFGGRASGPGPLVKLFEHAVATFASSVRAKQRQLTRIQCHSLMTMIGEVVVSGGVRRSAMISLSDPDDASMRLAKVGEWWKHNPHFALANNSAVWHGRPDASTFLREWTALIESGSGERGMLNRKALQDRAARRGREPREFLVNPCAEISLRSEQTCNLTEVIVRAQDTYQSLAEKVEVATILGTMQSLLTGFQYVRPSWRANCEEERLLGVSLSGIYDHGTLSHPKSAGRTLRPLKELAIETNRMWAAKFGINRSAAITCIKPSGTVSQLVDCASGIHPRYAPVYLRRVRANKIEPITQMMIDQGMPYEDDRRMPGTVVFTFPQRATAHTTSQNLRALEHLDLARVYTDDWCDHNVSLTVSVRPDEWVEVGGRLYEDFDNLSCASFLPINDHTYEQAPYESTSDEKYHVVSDSIPHIDWSLLSKYENEDTTTVRTELACTGGSCDIV